MSLAAELPQLIFVISIIISVQVYNTTVVAADWLTGNTLRILIETVRILIETVRILIEIVRILVGIFNTIIFDQK